MSINEDSALPEAESISTPVALVAIILVGLNLRPAIVSVGPVLPAIIAEFRLTHATASLLTAIPVVFMGALSLPTAGLARRIGRDRLMLLALLVLAGSTAGRAFCHTTAGLLVSAAGVGTGIAVAGTLIAGFIKARFPAQAARVMGVYATSLSAGSVVSAAATGPVALANWGGWRLAFGMWSLLCVPGLAAWVVLMRQDCARRPSAPTVPMRLPLNNLTAWLVGIFFAAQLSLFYALVAWIVPLYREAGFSGTTAGLILGTFTVVFLCATAVPGWLSLSDDRRIWLASCTALTLVGLVLLALAPGRVPFVFISLCGGGLGGVFTLVMTLPLDNARSVEESNAWNAFVLTLGFIFASVGPLAVGRLRDMTGDFRFAVWMLATVAALMLLLTPFLRPHHHRARARAR